MMPNATVKLKREEFTEERVMPLVRAISEEAVEKGAALNSIGALRANFPEVFQELMGVGIGHAWIWKDRGLLLALKTHDIFSAKLRSTILLAAVLPVWRGTNIARELFEAHENWARAIECVDISGASHAVIRPRDEAWEKHGYSKTETIFSKNLEKG